MEPAIATPDPGGEANAASLQPHPQASRVPALPDRDYLELRADIERRGLLAATDLALPTVPTRVVSTDDELAYMLLSALRRRQLDPGQRAALALELDLVRSEKANAAKRKAANRSGSIEVANLPLREQKTRSLIE